MNKKSLKHFISALFIMLFLFSNLVVTAEDNTSKVDRKKLEERVRELLKLDRITFRKYVNEVFLLADIYASEGRDKEAINLYQQALEVDAWRLEYQLKLARLLQKCGDTNQALEKAKIVYQYAEDEDLIKGAEEFLSSLGIKLTDEKDVKPAKIVKSIEIIIVPVGKVNKRLLSELKNELEARMGIRFSIIEKELDPGKIDRTFADQYLTGIVERIKSRITPIEMKELLSRSNLKAEDLKTYKGKLKFIEAFFDKIGLSEDGLKEFHDCLKKYESQRQYNADRLNEGLEQVFVLNKGSSIKGYLGITEEDIFSSDYNFLFGWARPGYGVNSYHRFRAVFNGEPPNRQRLVKRMLKQAISSSFAIFGIPRCTTPTCARAYPQDLTEHDQKSDEICPWCREKLNAYIRNNS